MDVCIYDMVEIRLRLGKDRLEFGSGEACFDRRLAGCTGYIEWIINIKLGRARKRSVTLVGAYLGFCYRLYAIHRA
jgi:hypothetical protein